MTNSNVSGKPGLVHNSSKQTIQSGALAGRNETELGQVNSERVDCPGASTDEMVPHPMQHQCRLLRLGLDRDETHPGALHGFTACLGIRGIVFVALYLSSGRHNAQESAPSPCISEFSAQITPHYFRVIEIDSIAPRLQFSGFYRIQGFCGQTTASVQPKIMPRSDLAK